MTRAQEFRIIGYIFIGASFGVPLEVPLYMRLVPLVIALIWFEAALRETRKSPLAKQ